MKQHLYESVSKNDESVCAAPAFIIGEKEPEWDSFLDDTKVEVELTMVNNLFFQLSSEEL